MKCTDCEHFDSNTNYCNLARYEIFPDKINLEMPCAFTLLNAQQQNQERTETHPARYCDGLYECKDVLKDRLAHKKLTGIQAFFYGCAFKYIWRLGEKDDEKKEIDKAINYLEFLKMEF